MVVSEVLLVHFDLSAFLAVKLCRLGPLEPHGARIVFRSRFGFQTSAVVTLERHRFELPVTVITRKPFLVNMFTLFTFLALPNFPTLRHTEQLDKTFVFADVSALLRRPRGRGVVGRRRLRTLWRTRTVATPNVAALKRRAVLHIPADLRVIVDPVCGESPIAMGARDTRLRTIPFIQTV